VFVILLVVRKFLVMKLEHTVIMAKILQVKLQLCCILIVQTMLLLKFKVVLFIVDQPQLILKVEKNLKIYF
jgi:hypothetical protein